MNRSNYLIHALVTKTPEDTLVDRAVRDGASLSREKLKESILELRKKLADKIKWNIANGA